MHQTRNRFSIGVPFFNHQFGRPRSVRVVCSRYVLIKAGPARRHTVRSSLHFARQWTRLKGNDWKIEADAIVAEASWKIVMTVFKRARVSEIGGNEKNGKGMIVIQSVCARQFSASIFESLCILCVFV